MTDDAFLQALLWPGLPLWIVALVVIVRTIRDWPGIMERWNERMRDRASEKAGDWQRLRDEVGRLDARAKDLEHQRDEKEEENERCHRELDDAHRRIAELEGYLMGRGEAKQDAARIVAVERLEDHRAQADKAKDKQ